MLMWSAVQGTDIPVLEALPLLLMYAYFRIHYYYRQSDQ